METTGEVIRKASHLKQMWAAQGTNNCGCNKIIVGEEMRCPIFKAMWRGAWVYSVIAETDIVDAQGDVMSAGTVRSDGSQLHADLPEIRQPARLEGS